MLTSTLCSLLYCIYATYGSLLIGFQRENLVFLSILTQEAAVKHMFWNADAFSGLWEEASLLAGHALTDMRA